MELGLNDFDAGKSITQANWKGRELKSRLFDTNGTSFARFQGLKKSGFQGSPLPMAFVMDIARIKIITSRDIQYKQQVN
jgi:hypothetical protein